MMNARFPRRLVNPMIIRRYLPIVALALLGAPAWPQIALNPVPSRTVGHPQTPQPEQNSLYTVNPNLVEGRELYEPQGLAVDTSMSPMPIYVSDTGNNRVLAWKNRSEEHTSELQSLR